jgi:hypothetical protein
LVWLYHGAVDLFTNFQRLEIYYSDFLADVESCASSLKPACKSVLVLVRSWWPGKWDRHPRISDTLDRGETADGVELRHISVLRDGDWWFASADLGLVQGRGSYLAKYYPL